MNKIIKLSLVTLLSGAVISAEARMHSFKIKNKSGGELYVRLKGASGAFAQAPVIGKGGEKQVDALVEVRTKKVPDPKRPFRTKVVEKRGSQKCSVQWSYDQSTWYAGQIGAYCVGDYVFRKPDCATEIVIKKNGKYYYVKKGFPAGLGRPKTKEMTAQVTAKRRVS